MQAITVLVNVSEIFGIIPFQLKHQKAVLISYLGDFFCLCVYGIVTCIVSEVSEKSFKINSSQFLLGLHIYICEILPRMSTKTKGSNKGLINCLMKNVERFPYTKSCNW